MISIDPIRNPRATRRIVYAAWALLSVASVVLALGRSGATLRASLAVHTVAAAGGQRVYVLQNEGASAWHRARLWLDERYYAEHLSAGDEPGMAWRITGGELIDLQTAPLALVDPFYVGVSSGGSGGPSNETVGRGAPADYMPGRARLVVGPDVLEFQSDDIVVGNSSTP